MKRTVLLALTTTHHGLYRGAARYAREHNWNLISDMLYAATIPHGWNGDGILSHIGYWHELADFVCHARVPKVELSVMRDDLNLPFVAANNERIGEMAAEHFLERSYRNIAWAPFIEDRVSVLRLNGLRGRLAKEGLDCHILPAQNYLQGLPPQLTWANNRVNLLQEVERLPKPLAIFCYNDCVAANLLRMCDEAGYLVPEEIAILGTDNDLLLCQSLHTPLSSVKHNIEELGYQGAALLDRLMDGETLSEPPPLVEPLGIEARLSTDMQAVGNVQVARALRYIRGHYQDPHLSVDTVVAATNLSRRPLEIAFKREVGHTILEDVIQNRLDYVCERLCGSDDSVTRIAEDSGFRRSNHLFRTFRKHFGTSPQQFRATNGDIPG